MPTKAILAAITLSASAISGVALGSYTIGGFQMRDAVDILAQYGRHDEAGEGGEWRPASTGSIQPDVVAYHVCKGCDAHPYRDQAWTPDAYEMADAGLDDPVDPEVGQVRYVGDWRNQQVDPGRRGGELDRLQGQSAPEGAALSDASLPSAVEIQPQTVAVARN